MVKVQITTQPFSINCISFIYNQLNIPTAMNTINALNNQELLEKVEDCTLSPELFTHENKLRLSWILINKFGLKVATHKNCKLKEQYYINTLNSNKFNLPLTKAYTEILYYFMGKSSTKNFDKLLREFPRLKYDFKNLVKTHYGYDSLKNYRTTDLKPLGTILFTF